MRTTTSRRILKFYCQDPEAENITVKLADHRNINKLDYEHFEARPGDKLFDKIIEPAYFAEVQAAITMQQTVRAMSHMHGSGVCLHDLKQEFSCCTQAPQAGGSGLLPQAGGSRLPAGAGAPCFLFQTEDAVEGML